MDVNNLKGFSKAPWKVEEIPETEWTGRPTYNVVDAEGNDVVGSEGLWCGIEEDKANAELIAAAPSMRSQILILTEALENIRDHGKTCSKELLISVAETALLQNRMWK